MLCKCAYGLMLKGRYSVDLKADSKPLDLLSILIQLCLSDMIDRKEKGFVTCRLTTCFR